MNTCIKQGSKCVSLWKASHSCHFSDCSVNVGSHLNIVASKSKLLSSHECGSTKSPPKVLSVYRFSQLLVGKQYFPLLYVFENVCFLSPQVDGMVCFVPHEPKTLYRVWEVSRGRWHLPHCNITRPEDWLVCICGGWPVSFTVYVFVNII